MYDLFASQMRRNIGVQIPPELAYLRRTYQREIRDVKTYYRKHPKRVLADNVIANLLFHLPLRPDLDDRRYVRFIEDTGPSVTRAFGMTSSIYKGRLHPKGIALGPDTTEALMVSYEDFSLQKAHKNWIHWTPFRYLYHTRTDPNLPILNNTTPGKGYGVGILNVPMLALQYRYWRENQDTRDDGGDDIYRFVGGVVLPNLLESYFEIAYFNRLARSARGIKTRRYPVPHPFYLTDYSQRLDRLVDRTLQTYIPRGQDLEQMAGVVPMVLSKSLLSLMALPQDPITRANEWAYMLAFLPYVGFLVRMGLKEDNTDGYFMNQIYLTLREAERDNAFNGVGGTRLITQFRGHVRELVDEIDGARKGQR